MIKPFFREVKYAWQRIVVGHDERVGWSVDYWLNPIMLDVLPKLKEEKIGVPVKFFTKDDDHSDESLERAKKLWVIELDKMINGFRAAQDINDMCWISKEEYDKLHDIFEIGMNSFRDNYFSLWD